MTDNRTIYITEPDMRRLRSLVEKSGSTFQKDSFKDLASELDRALVVAAGEVPSDVVTMNSHVRLRNLDTNEEMIFTLVFPTDANIEQQKISVLAPVGTAMLGQKLGDEVEWPVPSGTARLRIEQIFYQPEAAGHFAR